MGHERGIALITIRKGHRNIITKGYENLESTKYLTGTVGIRSHGIGLPVHVEMLRQLARVHLYLYKSFTVLSSSNIDSVLLLLLYRVRIICSRGYGDQRQPNRYRTC